MSATNARLKAAEELLGSHGWPQASGNQAVVEIYLAALQQEAPSRSSLIRAGFDPEHVDYALLLLHNRGALNASNVEAIEVFAPRSGTAYLRHRAGDLCQNSAGRHRATHPALPPTTQAHPGSGTRRGSGPRDRVP